MDIGNVAVLRMYKNITVWFLFIFPLTWMQSTFVVWAVKSVPHRRWPPKSVHWVWWVFWNDLCETVGCISACSIARHSSWVRAHILCDNLNITAALLCKCCNVMLQWTRAIAQTQPQKEKNVRNWFTNFPLFSLHANSPQRKLVMTSPRQPVTGKVLKSPSVWPFKTDRQPLQWSHQPPPSSLRLWRNHHVTARRSRTVSEILRKSIPCQFGITCLYISNHLSLSFCSLASFQLSTTATSPSTISCPLPAHCVHVRWPVNWAAHAKKFWVPHRILVAPLMDGHHTISLTISIAAPLKYQPNRMFKANAERD